MTRCRCRRQTTDPIRDGWRQQVDHWRERTAYRCPECVARLAYGRDDVTRPPWRVGDVLAVDSRWERGWWHPGVRHLQMFRVRFALARVAPADLPASLVR